MPATPTSSFPGGLPSPPYGVNDMQSTPPPPPPVGPAPANTGGGSNKRRWALIAGAVFLVGALVAGVLYLQAGKTDKVAIPNSTQANATTTVAAAQDVSACADSFAPAADPLGDAAAVGTLAQTGTGAVGRVLWSVDASKGFNADPAEADRYEVIDRTDTAIVIANLPTPAAKPIVVTARSAADGKHLWSGAVVARTGSSGETVTPQVVDNHLWYSYQQGQKWQTAALDFASGKISACVVGINPLRVPASMFVAGSHAFEIRKDTDAATSSIALMGPDKVRWTAKGNYSAVLGGNDQVVVVGSLMDGLYRTADAKVAGLSIEDGSILWEASLREITASATSMDGAPKPTWEPLGPNDNNVGLIAPTGYSPSGVTQGAKSAAVVSFMWSPAGAAASVKSGISSYLVTVKVATGDIERSGYLWANKVGLLGDGDQSLFVAPAGASRRNWLHVTDTTAGEVAGSDSYGGTAGGGRLMVNDITSTDGEAVALIDPDKGVIGAVAMRAAIGEAPFGTGVLTAEMWTGFVVTGFKTKGVAPTYALVTYALVAAPASGGGQGS